ETLARAVHAAHQAGIIHRDLKPANILLVAEDSGRTLEEGAVSASPTARPSLTEWFPKLTDFGLAKKLGSAGQTATGVVMGTPSSMAPGRAEGKGREIGPPADVYARGAILYELLTGRPPFKAGSPLETMAQVVSDLPVPPRQLQADMPADLETVCLKC